MTKNELVNVIVILLDLNDSHKADFAKLSVPTLKATYESLLKTAKSVGNTNEISAATIAENKALKMQLRNLNSRK